MDELISRQAAIDTLNIGAELLRRVLDEADIVGVEREKYEWGLGLIESCISDMEELPPAQPECAKEFVALKVIDLNGRPYYSIIYLEDGREYEGYSSYDLMVISEYIKRYFGFAQPEIIRCKDCKHNPKESWLGCPMSHLSEEQRPETAWCWKAERREVEP